MKISAARLREHVRMAEGFNTYDPDLKRKFLRAAADVGRELLRQLGVEGDVHTCAGGPAVRGGVSVYSENLYVCIEPSITRPTWFYYRGCDRRGDCGAGLRWGNQSVNYSRLLEILEPDSKLIQEMRRHMEHVAHVKKGD